MKLELFEKLRQCVLERLYNYAFYQSIYDNISTLFKDLYEKITLDLKKILHQRDYTCDFIL